MLTFLHLLVTVLSTCQWFLTVIVCLLSSSRLQDLCLVNDLLSPLLVKVLHYFYEKDVLSEEVILWWYQQRVRTDEYVASRTALRKQASPAASNQKVFVFEASYMYNSC